MDGGDITIDVAGVVTGLTHALAGGDIATEGQIGLGTRNAKSRFDDITVTDNTTGQDIYTEDFADSDAVEDVVTTSTYTYNDSGIRVQQAVTEGGNTTTTNYVIDPNNFRGYAQVLEERDDTSGDVTKSFIIGHDVIAQATAAAAVLTMLYDAHGSTRALLDGSGDIAENTSANNAQQIFTYDAYGNLILTAAGVTAQAQALTAVLYSGELTDRVTGMQYLRARYYNPSVGRLNRLDPFAGAPGNPLSLHEYLYTHGNPIMGIDPLGLFSITELAVVSGIRSTLTDMIASVGGDALDAGESVALGARFNQALVGSVGISTGLGVVTLAASAIVAVGAKLLTPFAAVLAVGGFKLLGKFIKASGLFFENYAIRMAREFLGEVILDSKIVREGVEGSFDLGVDFASVSGKGIDAQLFINEAKNVKGTLFPSDLTAFGLGKGGPAVWGRNKRVVRDAIQNLGLDDLTQATLIGQLDNNDFVIRVIGSQRKGTELSPSAANGLLDATGANTLEFFQL